MAIDDVKYPKVTVEWPKYDPPATQIEWPKYDMPATQIEWPKYDMPVTNQIPATYMYPPNGFSKEYLKSLGLDYDEELKKMIKEEEKTHDFKFEKLEDALEEIQNKIKEHTDKCVFIQLQKSKTEEFLTKIHSGIPEITFSVVSEDSVIFHSVWKTEKENLKIDSKADSLVVDNTEIYKNSFKKYPNYNFGEKNKYKREIDTDIIDFIPHINYICVYNWGFQIDSNISSYLFFTTDCVISSKSGELKYVKDALSKFNEEYVKINNIELFKNVKERFQDFFTVDLLTGYWIKNENSVKFSEETDIFLDDFNKDIGNVGQKDFTNLEL